MPRLSDNAARLRPGVFAELEPQLQALAARGGNVVPLHIGDTYLQPPAAASWARAAERLSKDALYRYGSTQGLPELRGSIARDYAARGITGPHGAFTPTAVNVAIGVGGTHALWAAARALLDPGDEVLACAPYWPLAPGVLHIVGALAVDVPLTQELYAHQGYDVAGALRSRITERTRAIYFVSPNNPDGKVLSHAQLEAIYTVARENDLWVFADEVYADFCFEASHVSFAALDPKLERTVILGSFSKSHALAGVRVGYAIAPEEVVTAALRITTHAGFNVPVLAQRVCLDALEHGTPWKQGARDVYAAARDLALDGVRGLGLTTHVPDGGTYLFIDFASVLAGRPLRDLLARGVEKGVLLAPGAAFGDAYATYARLCFTAVPPAELTRGIERLGDALRTF